MIETISNATGSVIDALKREPLSLALVVMNLALLFFFYVILNKVADTREREIAMIHAANKEIREMLVKCAEVCRGNVR